jgi:hypothetical protein
MEIELPPGADFGVEASGATSKGHMLPLSISNDDDNNICRAFNLH